MLSQLHCFTASVLSVRTLLPLLSLLLPLSVLTLLSMLSPLLPLPVLTLLTLLVSTVYSAFVVY